MTHCCVDSADAEQTNGLAGCHTAEEEIHSISQGARGPRVEEDILEVVRADFLARSRKFNQGTTFATLPFFCFLLK